MSLAALWDAIADRGNADSGTNKLVGSGGLCTGIWNTEAPESVLHPYLVYTTASATSRDTFTGEVDKVIIRFAFWVPRRPPAGTDSMNIASLIGARILGDSSGGSTPTYGFHRWKPTLSGSWTAGQMIRTQVIENHSDEHYSFVHEYEIYLRK